MASTTAFKFPLLSIPYTEQVSDNGNIFIRIPGIENFSREKVSDIYAEITRNMKSTPIDPDALVSALNSIKPRPRSLTPTPPPSPWVSPSQRTRSLALSLDEDSNSETNQSISRILALTNGYRINAEKRSIQSRPWVRRSKAYSILEPTATRISKQPSTTRSLRRRIPTKKHNAEHLDVTKEDSQNAQQVEPQTAHLTSPASFPIYDQRGSPKGQPDSPTEEAHSFKASNTRQSEGAHRAHRSGTRARKFSTQRDVGSLTSSMVQRKRSQRSPARGSRHLKQVNVQECPQEYKTRSGRVSKKPRRLGFT